MRAPDPPGSGLWIDEPHRVLVFGLLYFTDVCFADVGVPELFGHRRLPTTQRHPHETAMTRRAREDLTTANQRAAGPARRLAGDRAMRVLALSDVHADAVANRAWLDDLSAVDYVGDVLLLAGDVSHDLDTMARTLEGLRAKFGSVVFVPGNHDLWISRHDEGDSLDKLRRIFQICRRLDIHTTPVTVGDGAVHVVPLLGWYARPAEGPDSLFVPKPGDDRTESMWRDDRYIDWRSLSPGVTPCTYFLSLNTPHLETPPGIPVISLSHFLPRRELIFSARPVAASGEDPRSVAERRFNFSRVAGTAGLERQLRHLAATVHVYGHQHRNRRRWIDGVLYVSHCLGYPHERRRQLIRGMDNGPTPVWDTGARRLPRTPSGPAREPPPARRFR